MSGGKLPDKFTDSEALTRFKQSADEPLYTKRQVVDEIMACEGLSIYISSGAMVSNFTPTTDEVMAKLK